MPYTPDISRLTSYNPYVETTPIETLEAAGLQRQQQYDQGMQLIQQTNQQTKDLGSQLIGSQRQEYFKSKLSAQQNALASSITGDLSNMSLVNNINGAIKSITNDDIIKTGLISSSTIRSNQELQSKMQAEGKSHENNDIYFQDDVQKYANAPLVDANGKPTSFNSKYYQFSDWRKKARDVTEKYISQAKKEQSDKPYLDKDGKYVNIPTGVLGEAMQREIIEGRDAAQIRALVESSLDDNERKQMQIDGYVKYRGYDVPQMQQVSNNHFKMLNEQAYKNIETLEYAKNRVGDNQVLLTKLDNQIQTIKDQLKTSKDKYDATINLNPKNLEGFKNYIYNDEEMHNFSNEWSNMSRVTELVNNPIQQKRNEDRNYNLSVQRLNNETKWKEINYAFDVSKENRAATQEQFNNTVKLVEAGLLPSTALTQFNSSLKLPTNSGFSTPESTDMADAKVALVNEATKVAEALKVIQNDGKKNYTNLSPEEYNKTFMQGVSIFETGSKEEQDSWNKGPNKFLSSSVQKYIETKKNGQYAVNLIDNTKKEIENKTEYKNFKKEENIVLNDNKVLFKSYKYGDELSLSTKDIKEAIDRGDATLGHNKALVGRSYWLTYKKPDGSTFKYELGPEGAFGMNKSDVRPILSNISNYFEKNKEIINKKRTDYDTLLKQKLFSAAPQVNALGITAKQSVLDYIENVIVKTQEGIGNSSTSGVKFDVPLAKAFAAEKTPQLTYVSYGNDVNVQITSTEGKTKGQVQSFTIPKDKFREVFKINPLELPANYMLTKAIGNTNLNKDVITYHQALTNPEQVFSTAGYKPNSFPNVSKYRITGDMFYDQSQDGNDKNNVSPIIYVTDPETQKVVSIPIAGFVSPNTAETIFNSTTDAQIAEKLKELKKVK